MQVEFVCNIDRLYMQFAHCLFLFKAIFPCLEFTQKTSYAKILEILNKSNISINKVDIFMNVDTEWRRCVGLLFLKKQYSLKVLGDLYSICLF